MFVVVQYIDTFFTDYWLFCSIDAFFYVFIVQQMKKLYTFASFFRDKDDKSLCKG